MKYLNTLCWVYVSLHVFHVPTINIYYQTDSRARNRSIVLFMKTQSFIHHWGVCWLKSADRFQFNFTYLNCVQHSTWFKLITVYIPAIIHLVSCGKPISDLVWNFIHWKLYVFFLLKKTFLCMVQIKCHNAHFVHQTIHSSM